MRNGTKVASITSSEFETLYPLEAWSERSRTLSVAGLPRFPLNRGGVGTDVARAHRMRTRHRRRMHAET